MDHTGFPWLGLSPAEQVASVTSSGLFALRKSQRGAAIYSVCLPLPKSIHSVSRTRQEIQALDLTADMAVGGLWLTHLLVCIDELHLQRLPFDLFQGPPTNWTFKRQRHKATVNLNSAAHIPWLQDKLSWLKVMDGSGDSSHLACQLYPMGVLAFRLRQSSMCSCKHYFA